MEVRTKNEPIVIFGTALTKSYDWKLFFLLTIVTTDELSTYIYIFTQKSQISLNDREQQDRYFLFILKDDKLVCHS